MRIVGIGGGTGLPVLLSGLKALNEAGEKLDITAIVTVADNGGSTGALREAFKMPAMGDIRKCMIALATEESVLTSVCRHRFKNPAGFAGHSLGNLILSALFQISGDFAAAVSQACDLLHLQGRVLPATEHAVTLCALYEDGGVTRGEEKIPQPGRRIQAVWLEGAASQRPIPYGSSDMAHSPYALSPPAAAGVIEALERADVIVLGPGSLFTSIIPNLLVAGVPDAIRNSRAVKVYLSNLMTQPGETDGYSAADHVRTLLQYMSPLDLCVLNSSTVGMGLAQRYLKSGSQIVSGSSQDEEEIRRIGVTPVAAPLLKDREIKARHDPTTLARLVVSVARGSTDSQEIMCGQRNGG
jgi:2-phospho-L-lactate transferase/gluconeogenesis factor (CofD/UPF0052 family)